MSNKQKRTLFVSHAIAFLSVLAIPQSKRFFTRFKRFDGLLTASIPVPQK